MDTDKAIVHKSSEIVVVTSVHDVPSSSRGCSTSSRGHTSLSRPNARA